MQYFSSPMLILLVIGLLFFSYAANRHFSYFETNWFAIGGGSLFLTAAVLVEWRNQRKLAKEVRALREIDEEDE
jgi:hypothetical protein